LKKSFFSNGKNFTTINNSKQEETWHDKGRKVEQGWFD
jgi:hypothetical protein